MVIHRAIREPLAGSPFSSRMKCTPWAFAAAAMAAGASIYNNQQSMAQANNLDWENRQWQESMYNTYSSPKALMKQYRDAGVNPYLSGQGNWQGSFNPQIPQALGSLSDPGQSFASGLSAGGSVIQADSIAGNQQAEEFSNIISGLSKSVEMLGTDNTDQILSLYYPKLRSLGFDDSNINKIVGITIGNKAAQQKILQVVADWEQKFGSDFRSTNFMKLNQEVNKIVGELNLMQKTGHLTDSQIAVNKKQLDVMTAQMVQLFASAFNLKKQGEYYEVSASTARQIQQYVVSSYILQNGLQRLSLNQGKLAYEEYEAGHYERLTQEENNADLKWWLNSLNGYFHVGGNFNFSDIGNALK